MPVAAAAGMAGLVTWSYVLQWWQRHYQQVILVAVGTLASLTAALLVLWRQKVKTRAAKAAVEDEPTWVYRHYMADGTPLYYGITGRYDLRCGQHEESSWWWPLVDHGRSVSQKYPNRHVAELRETALIRRDCPPGNRKDNPRWAGQAAWRAELTAAAAQVRADRAAAALTTGRS